MVYDKHIRFHESNLIKTVKFLLLNPECVSWVIYQNRQSVQKKYRLFLGILHKITDVGDIGRFDLQATCFVYDIK